MLAALRDTIVARAARHSSDRAARCCEKCSVPAVAGDHELLDTQWAVDDAHVTQPTVVGLTYRIQPMSCAQHPESACGLQPHCQVTRVAAVLGAIHVQISCLAVVDDSNVVPG